MVKNQRMALASVMGLALVAAVVYATRAEAPVPSGPLPARDSAGPRGIGELPRIDLGRLEAQRPDAPAGRRDVFDFGAAAQPTRSVSTPAVPVATMPVVPVETAPTSPPVPALNVKFIGAVEDKKGMKVAILMTDKKEILTGQAGDVVANRLKIIKIGLESVDVQDVGGGSVRRIPLRGN
jgi:hypothetical protein